MKCDRPHERIGKCALCAIEKKDEQIALLNAMCKALGDKLAARDDRVRALEHSLASACEALDSAVDRIKLAYRGDCETPLAQAVAPFIDTREKILAVLANHDAAKGLQP